MGKKSQKRREAARKRKGLGASGSSSTGNGAFPLLKGKMPKKSAKPLQNKNNPNTALQSAKPALLHKLKNPPKDQLKVEEISSSEEEEGLTWDAKAAAKVEEIDSDLEFSKANEGGEGDEGDDEEEDEEEEEEEEESESEEEEVDPKQKKKQQQTAPKPKRVPIEKTHARTNPSQQKQQGSQTTVYVNQLPYSATKDEITEHFSGCGVSEVRMCFTGDSFRGTAFVVVKDGPKALALHQSKLGGRVINVRPQLSQEGLAAVAERGRAIKKHLPNNNNKGGSNKKAKNSNKKNNNHGNNTKPAR